MKMGSWRGNSCTSSSARGAKQLGWRAGNSEEGSLLLEGPAGGGLTSGIPCGGRPSTRSLLPSGLLLHKFSNASPGSYWAGCRGEVLVPVPRAAVETGPLVQARGSRLGLGMLWLVLALATWQGEGLLCLGAPMVQSQSQVLMKMKAVWGRTTDLSQWNPARDCSLWGSRVRCNSKGSLIFLDLSRASLEGPVSTLLPQELGQLTTLEYFDASVNHLYPSVPAFLGTLPRLKTLWLHGNWFDLPLPKKFFKAKALERLRLDNNWLNGTFPPSIARLESLSFLSLTHNLFSGPFPPALCQLKSMQELRISANRFRGRVPQCIGKLTNMRLLYIDTNSFTGVVPATISGMTRLENLFINQNRFSTPFPPTLTQMKSLKVLFMSSNPLLSGPLPPNIGNMASLANLVCEFCALSGSIPRSMSKLTNMERLLLDNNRMTGRVPKGLSRLHKLTQLYLEFNFFSGEFPRAITKLPNLVLFSLYHNQFTGPAPTHLVSPKVLQLSVYANYFTGRAAFKAGNKAFCSTAVNGSKGVVYLSSYETNCLTFDSKTCPPQPQRSAQECRDFCGANTGKACAGHGYCTTRVNGYPRCVCNSRYKTSADGKSCIRSRS